MARVAPIKRGRQSRPGPAESPPSRPERARSGPEPVGGIPVAAVVALAAIYLAGILLKKTEVFPTLVLTGIWASAAVGLGVLVGRTGQLSLGQGALSAVAAYTSGYFSARHGLDFAEAVLLGLAAALVVSLVTSPILRVRGFYFALATLALAVVVDELLVAWQGLTGGANGLNGIHALTAFGRRITSETAFFNIGWFTAVIAAAVIAVFFRSRFGRALKALTVDEDLAASVGVPCARYKMGVWLLSGLLAGIAGVLYAYYNVFLTPDEFGIDRSITLIAAVVVGGAATVLGPIVGLIGVMVVPQLLNIGQGGTTAVTAVVLVVTAVVMPDGLVPEGGRAVRLLWSRLRPAAAPVPVAEVSGGGGEERPVVESAGPRQPAPPAGTALEVKGLCKRFGGLSVLNGVDLSVEPGHIHGLIGPNGAGKTSLINCITGLLEPDGGEVRLFGEDVTRARTDALCRTGLVRTFQHTRLLPEESVLENVVVGAHTMGTSGVVSALLRTAGIRREERDLYRRALAALDSMGCGTLAQEKAANLTAGQQRLVQVARGLVAGPRVLLLDEPAAGLNETEVARLGGYLDALRRLGTTIVLVEHHLDLIMSVCDRISVLSGGVIIADGVPEAIRRNELVIDAYLGAAS